MCGPGPWGTDLDTLAAFLPVNPVRGQLLASAAKHLRASAGHLQIEANEWASFTYHIFWTLCAGNRRKKDVVRVWLQLRREVVLVSIMATS